jgi:hypothetical protein
MLKKFGSEQPDLKKGNELAALMDKTNRALEKDPGLVGKIEANPEAALKELGFTDKKSITHFRLLDGVSTKDSCSCSCFPISCGTGVGCNSKLPGAPGSSSYTHD